MKKSRFSLVFVAFSLFLSLPVAAKKFRQETDERPTAAPIENLIVDESPYAKPYLPEVVGKNQQGWRCDSNGNRDSKNLDGICYDLNDGSFRIRTTRYVGRGAIESVFFVRNSKPELRARFDRKNELNQNALLYESPDAVAFRLAKEGKGGPAVADKSAPGSSQPESPNTAPADAVRSAVEGALGKALGSIIPRIPK